MQARRRIRRSPGREHPGGRRDSGRRKRRERVRADRREHSGGQGRRRQRFRRDDQSIRLPALRSHARRRGYDPLPDHQDGFRRGGNESADCKGRRQGIRRVRADRHHHCRHHHRRVAARAASLSVSHWRAASPCWSSAARARSAWRRRSPSWSATAWAQKTAFSSRPPFRWKKPARREIVALDKTGTITTGEPRVTDVLPADGLIGTATCLTLAAALEQRSEHPLARAVMQRAERRQAAASPRSRDFRALPGNGLTATLDGEELLGGSLSFISTKADRCLQRSARRRRSRLRRKAKRRCSLPRAAGWRA